ncbi:FAD:protein FMN transferase [Idiomarina ramblicola]|uniref:FAD:protein FMN transferase n=1 Tax=Idiomarina ramblicola TaxID=263724 RepID=A0A432YV89_9GAMM|nr:FAD:protein FMN transferase [Idiomarina ramblicola]RUO67248.1 FAD:protein FMN transferase ApbE [Idiomarina ramblicola]
MMLSKLSIAKVWLALMGLAFLVSCSDSPEKITFSDSTMGTTYSVTLYTKDPRHNKDEIKRKVDIVLERVNAQMSTYDPESELSQFNQFESTEPMVISRDLERVVTRALEIAEQTDGALDITIGPLVNLWGFGPQARPENEPSESELEAVRKRTGYQKLRVQNHQLIKDESGMYVDLSTIAKGYGVDRVGHLLDQLRIKQYLVEIGGEVVAKGGKPDEASWRLAIEKPVSTERAVQRVVEFKDGALATSGDYRNYYEEDGRRYSHIIDPATGSPIQHNLVSVSVYADDTMSADAYATALLVMGTDKAKAFSEKHNLAVMLIYKTEDGFDEYISDAFKPLLNEQE